MSDISRIDSNFKIDSHIKQKDVRFYDVKQKPFQIYGVFYDSGKFRRLPEEIAKSVSSGVYALHANTAGGRVRFVTDSPYVAIHAKMPAIGKMSHFPLTGSAGFDLYVNDEHVQTFPPPFEIQDGYESIKRFGSSNMREITIHFPLYSDVSELYIGVHESAVLLEQKPYKTQKPIVYYGSSITQGACASRPGNAYQNMIARRLDADYINLGFSGSAKGEPEFAEYIKTLDMSVFVYDYDYNAPTVEHLENTHKNFYSIIRNAQPDLPIVLMSRPKYSLSDDEKLRYHIIKKTYDEAKAAGDENIYILDGSTLMAFAKTEGTVDGCHPNDWGFASIAGALGDVLANII